MLYFITAGQVDQSIHPALLRPPDILDLLNKVAAEARDKWEQVAVQLRLEPGHIRSIQTEKQGRPILCYTEVFYVWQNKGSPPYTWSTIINTLRAPAVGEERLADELKVWVLRSQWQTFD